VSLTVK